MRRKRELRLPPPLLPPPRLDLTAAGETSMPGVGGVALTLLTGPLVNVRARVSVPEP